MSQHIPSARERDERLKYWLNKTRVSDESRQVAKAFAQRHSLSEAIENELAQLFENTWRDGAKADTVLGLIESMSKEDW